MADGYGTPIRLIFDKPENMREAGYENGMELNALSIALSVERKVGGMPMPLMGGRRVGIDLNRVNSTIIIEGIFTDDDHNRRTHSARGAVATIDFGLRQRDTHVVGDIPDIVTSNFGNLAKGSAELVLTEKDGTFHRVTFVESSGSVGHVSGGTVRVQDTSTSTYITAAQLATAVAAAVATFGAFTTTVTASNLNPSEGNTLLTLTQSNNGPMSTATSVRFLNSGFYTPYHTHFAKGSSSGTRSKSAGDKVQDLYGILHNTSRPGASALGGAVIAAGFAAATVATGGAAAIAAAGTAGAVGGGVVGGLVGFFATDGDYPIGIQIPYNSMIKAPDGKEYTARNFLVPTGIKGVDEKMSQGNKNAADVEFSTTDNMTGIQGAIQKFDVSYSAGEQVYTYQMVFAPIDGIV
jgi:hypothetical protein